jgi:DNA-binding NarL/FixJ family response regulator
MADRLCLAASIRLGYWRAMLAPSITRRPVERYAKAPAAVGSADASLNPREMDVLRHLARGLSNAELAVELYVGEATMKTQWRDCSPSLGRGIASNQ